VKTICLVMIVKDEAAVICRCLESVKPVIAHWVICDMGSTDNTPELIQTALSGIPGTLHRSPWVDFGHNRTQALKLAKGRADLPRFWPPPGSRNIPFANRCSRGYCNSCAI